MIALSVTFHVLPCVVIYTPVKAKHLYSIFKDLIPSLALNTVHGQEQSERLLERKSSFQDLILFAAWGIGHKNEPMFGFLPEKVLALI